MNELIGRRIRELHALLAGKHVSAGEIAQAHLNQIAKGDSGKIDAFLCLTEELALKQARAVDEKIARNEPLELLAGIPIAIKDNMCLTGYPTTCASKILSNFSPPHNCTAVARLIEHGAVLMGKTNMDEFAMGSSTENSSVKRTRNPWNTRCVPGGSSGGSAAAVAAGFAVAALGSDTGGSIRQPASFCGVVGMKPTYGVVSRFGLVAFASSLDQIGPLAGSVEDAAIVLDAICGHDPRDSTSLSDLSAMFAKTGAKSLVDGLENGSSPEPSLKPKRIGVIKELMGEGIDADVRSAISAAAQVLSGLGATVEEVSIPTVKYALPVYYILCTAEASANLARFDGVRYGVRVPADDILTMFMKTRQEGFGTEVKRRIMLGTYALSSGYYDAYYKKAQQVRRLIKEEFDKIFETVDCLICPTSPSSAFQFDEKTGDPITMYLSDIATIPVNLAGLPAISLPCGFDQKELPIGMQVIGPALSDASILQVARAFEQAAGHSSKPVPMFAS